MPEADTGERQGPRPRVEIGWIIAGDLAGEARSAARDAAERMRSELSDCMSRFFWSIEIVERPLEPRQGRIEPVRLLDLAETDRDRHGWDVTFVVTDRELRGRERTQLLGATSGIFATALISTAFLARSSSGHDCTTSRLHALAMHLFGRLNGLAPDTSDTLMREVKAPEDLDRMNGLNAAAITELTTRMEDVADLRVEELGHGQQSRLSFYVRSLWLNRSALPGAIARMRPWSFPLHLRRLTTAAGAALAVLVMTAESWEVAGNLSFATILLLSLISLSATSAYLLHAQHLLVRRHGPLREQRAVSDAGTVIAVALGMAVTYLGVFAVAFLMATGLFGDALLMRWVGGTAEPQALRLNLAALTASLSVVIGALGASFEPYGYFRHVTQIDDEL